ncbi:ABC transporter substrate-binding protein [Cohnella sp. GCM10012308]|uniref:ABC transporter substrate-binding protein n=1 Tax=Cohnella sp. GCM10012308 TaxID=3317329 RepID=UPI00360EFDD9
MRRTTSKGKWLTGAAAALALLTASACGNDNEQQASGSASGGSGASSAASSQKAEGGGSLAPVKLVWYMPMNEMPADLANVQAEANKIIGEKINATVELKVIPSFGDYNDKMNTTLVAGEQVDLMWTSNWSFDYLQNQEKDAFAELNALIDQYAGGLKDSLPAFVWDAVKVKGGIYAVPNYQTITNREGFVIQKPYVDKYNLDISAIKKLADIEPFLQQLKENEPGLTPFPMARGGAWFTHYEGFEEIAKNMSIGIRLDDPHTVVDFDQAPERKAFWDMQRRWMKNGWVNDDAAVVKQGPKGPVGGNNVLKPGGEAEAKIQNGGTDVVYAPLTEAFVNTNSITTTMTAISRTSKNPERAMMLINLVNTDPALYRLLSYGIEGKHYTLNADGTMHVNAGSGYAASDWAIGNVFNGYVLEGKDPGVFDATEKENENAAPSPILGFQFDVGPVSSELANLQTVEDEYYPALNTGAIDASKEADYLEKRKKAGVDKVIAEIQKQLDAWYASK